MKLEAEVKKKMVEDIRAEGGYARRIEDRFTVGMPDTVLIPKTLPVLWVEVKVVEHNLLKPSARQFIELRRLNIPPHSFAYILGWKAGILYIHPPVAGIRIVDCLQQQHNEPLGDYLRRAFHHNWPKIEEPKYAETV